MKRVLVTGSSGFIGRHALQPLETRGYEILNTGLPLKPGKEIPAGWVEADLLSADSAEKLLDQYRPTHLVHFAWHVDPADYATSRLNAEWVEASLRLLRLFAASGGRRAVLVGTCFEYDLRQGLLNETTSVSAPTSLYGISKDSLRRVALALSPQLDVSSAWVRIFHVFGSHEHPARMVPTAIRSLMAGRQFSCVHGRQIRDFLHVSDVGSAIAAVLDSPVEGIVNVASGEPCSIRELIYEIGTQLGCADLIRFGAYPTPAGDPPVILGDATRLREEVKWEPSLSFSDAVQQTIEWWKENSSAD